MPKIEVTRPIEINVGGRRTRLEPGFYELSDDDMKSWYIPGLMKSGDIAAFVEESDKPVVKLLYDVGKITLGEHGKVTQQESKKEVLLEQEEKAPAPTSSYKTKSRKA